MSKTESGRVEEQVRCPNCGAEIEVDVKPESADSGRVDAIRCPSCGTEVAVDGADPRLEEFGPGVGQSGA